MESQREFVYDVWYYAGLSSDFKKGDLKRLTLAGEPIVFGRKQKGELFALRDICAHRAAPLSEGRLLERGDEGETVECPYHGWRFSADDGRCKAIPSLCADSPVDPEKISVRRYAVRETGHLCWVFISSDKRFSGEPDIDPPHIALTHLKPRMQDAVMLDCHVDHAAIGLIDPAHGPYVHRQWWWRSEKSMHDKAKAFSPTFLGFIMDKHSPSSNSFGYKLLGGKPETEISFWVPGQRVEHIRVGKRTLISFTACTPVTAQQTKMSQVFFTDFPLLIMLSPLLRFLTRKFLRQDEHIFKLQKMCLSYDPPLMLMDGADTQAKWYHAIKKEWKNSRAEKRDFKHPVKPTTLRWRT